MHKPKHQKNSLKKVHMTFKALKHSQNAIVLGSSGSETKDGAL